MSESKKICYNPPFSHIYIEKRILSHNKTQEILSHFPEAERIEIDHYMDIFGRAGQDREKQKEAQALILAKKNPPFFYKGAPVCHSYGQENFYYCTQIMNCIFDCEYCFLKGMYPTAHILIYVNTEDFFVELEQERKQDKWYLSISYESDLPALEKFTGFVREWAEYTGKTEGLCVEVRTKSASPLMYMETPSKNLIYAFTLSPPEIMEKYEKGTAGPEARINLAIEGIKRGERIRLCFDPMLYLPEWKSAYEGMLQTVDEKLQKAGYGWEDLEDVSLGSFRMSMDHLKKYRKRKPDSLLSAFPYENNEGYACYPERIRREMLEFMEKELKNRLERVYVI